MSYVRTFLKHLADKYKPTRILVEYPVVHELKSGQIVKGWVDLLIDTPKDWVIVDHKFAGPIEEALDAEALKYSGQLKAYKDAVEAATEKTVAECWVHFPGSGRMISLAF